MNKNLLIVDFQHLLYVNMNLALQNYDFGIQRIIKTINDLKEKYDCYQ